MPTNEPPNPVNGLPVPIKRRKFLGIGLSGFAGSSLLGLFQARAQSAAEKPKANPVAALQTAKETTYWDRTDRFEEKIRLLEAAWHRKDFRLARALAHSLRSTMLQAQEEEESPGTPLMVAARYETVESLPAAWMNWAQSWNYYKALTLAETIGRTTTWPPGIFRS